MISTVTTATTTVSTDGISILWLFSLTLILSFIVSYLKCKKYNCSVKYGLLIGIITAILYGIITFILTMTTLPSEIANTGTFIPIIAISLVIDLLIVAVIPNIIVGILGGIIAVFLNKRSKRIPRKEISKKA
jgi:hypothetical protein